jgi:hypothetical protein
MVACLFITEISSPLLHLREMLKEFGVRDTDLNLLVDVLFAVTFSVARMGVGPYLTYVTVTADYPILIKVRTYACAHRIRSPAKPTRSQQPTFQTKKRIATTSDHATPRIF